MQENRKRIYVADDDDNIRQIVKTFLSSDGFEVEDFPTGDLLLKRFEERPCDLAILDVMMPGSDGFQICTALRERSTVPIIMLTARDSENDYAMGLGLGSDDYITKPFSAMALMLRVRVIEQGTNNYLLADEYFPLDPLQEGEQRTERLSLKSLIKEHCALEVELTGAEIAPLSYTLGLSYTKR